MYRERPAETDQEQIEDLIHLYIDGAFDRRELLKRVAIYTGSIAAAGSTGSGRMRIAVQWHYGIPGRALPSA